VESALGGPPDPAFVEACLRASGGTPFLLRELVGALNEGGIAPSAEAASHVERIGARSVGRSINLQLRRLPNHAGQLARALAVLEQSDLVQAARLAQLDEVQAMGAAALLASAGIVESGLHLTFVHPIVRRSIYDEISGAERAQAHRRAAHELTEHPGASQRVAEHLLVTEPAGDDWAVERLVEAACAARQQGAPESEAVFLRARSPSHRRRIISSALLPRPRTPEANAGLDGWAEHLQKVPGRGGNVAAAAEAALVLAHALSRLSASRRRSRLIAHRCRSVSPPDLAILSKTARPLSRR
jgi:hypothetical protein